MLSCPAGYFLGVARPCLVNGRRSCVCTSPSGSDRRTVQARVRRLLICPVISGPSWLTQPEHTTADSPQPPRPADAKQEPGCTDPPSVGAPSLAAQTLVFVPVLTFTGCFGNQPTGRGIFTRGVTSGCNTSSGTRSWRQLPVDVRRHYLRRTRPCPVANRPSLKRSARSTIAPG